MRIFKSHPLLKLVNSYLIDASQPSNISYLWNFGSLLLLCLVIQIITGVTLAMHYSPSVLEAFNSIEHIMRDVNNGWLVRYLHSNTASAFFFLVYLHIGRGMYYGSYRSPRTLVWALGTIIFILMIVTAFLGYVLPYGQMSLWGATVITNLVSAIPWIGQDIVEFIWGGFSVNNATLNRFFALHFVLPFILVALVLMHLIALHDTAGSSNPLGISGNYDRITFAPYYLFKDLITIFIFIFVLSLFVSLYLMLLGDSDNYIMANPMQTPPAIVPEWYLLPFYAILRSIPNKLLGVIAMLSAILAIMPITYWPGRGPGARRCIGAWVAAAGHARGHDPCRAGAVSRARNRRGGARRASPFGVAGAEGRLARQDSMGRAVTHDVGVPQRDGGSGWRADPRVRWGRCRHRRGGGIGGGPAAGEPGRGPPGAGRDPPSQIACFADRHILIEKVSGTATVRVLSDDERVHELSRMLAGLTGSDGAMTHAEELLATASASRSDLTV